MSWGVWYKRAGFAGGPWLLAKPARMWKFDEVLYVRNRCGLDMVCEEYGMWDWGGEGVDIYISYTY